MKTSKRRGSWLRPLTLVVGILGAALVFSLFLLSRSDGPWFIFAGGPLRSGESIKLTELNWNSLDSLHELEMEIVGEQSSLTLWFSVHDGVAYVACDLDCVGGVLTRWPQQIDQDNRVVIRIDDRLAQGQLIHVPHETSEYKAVRSGRNQKYAGGGGGRAAAETAAHSTVVNVGEALTGRAQSEEPGDKLYRIDLR